MKDTAGLDQIIQDQISQTVPQMIDDALNGQTHNGSDSQQIFGGNLVSAPQPTVAPITTTGAFGVDPVTTATVNQIIVQLRALGLFD